MSVLAALLVLFLMFVGAEWLALLVAVLYLTDRGDAS